MSKEDPDVLHDTEQADKIIAVATAKVPFREFKWQHGIVGGMAVPVDEVPKTEPGRPFDQQTALERTLRALLYQPVERLKRAELALPVHVRRKEYAAASDCQETIRRSKQEIQQWENLLRLYEAELHGSMVPLS